MSPEGKGSGYVCDKETWQKISSYEEELHRFDEDVQISGYTYKSGC